LLRKYEGASLNVLKETPPMLFSDTKLIEIFCDIDDFVIACEKLAATTKVIGQPSLHAVNKPSITYSEMLCIEIVYHLSGYKCFQYYYEDAVEKGALKDYFPNAPSYSRFIQLKPRIITLIVLYLQCCRLGSLCGLYYADSTSLSVCNNRRIHSHKVFKSQASRAKTSTGWFYGFKLFLVVNAFGEIVKVSFTTANVADNNLQQMLKIFNKLQGLVFADKGFINQNATQELLQKGLHLITGIRANMKNKLMLLSHKMLLKKRGMIESVNDILKTVCDLEHTRHRSPINALINVFAALCAYTFLQRLPSIFK
jgi:Transposase DDE domain